MLVDKLLATMEALHASEARNRESQASASQVRWACSQWQQRSCVRTHVRKQMPAQHPCLQTPLPACTWRLLLPALVPG